MVEYKLVLRKNTIVFFVTVSTKWYCAVAKVMALRESQVALSWEEVEEKDEDGGKTWAKTTLVW